MRIKSLIVGVLCVLGGAGFWYFVKDAIRIGEFGSMSVWFACSFFIICVTAFSLILLFVRSLLYTIGVFLLATAPILYFFGYGVPVLVCLVLALCASLRAYSRVRQEEESRINFRVRALLREGLPVVFTVLSLVLAVLYYVDTKETPKRIVLKDLVPPALFERILLYTPNIPGDILPDFDPHMTVDEYATQALHQNGIDISVLPKTEQERVLREARTQLFTSFLGTNGSIPVPDGSAKIGDVLYDSTTARSEQFIAPYEHLFPVAFAIAFFLFLRSVAFPFSWIIIWITMGIVKIFLMQGLMVRIKEQTTKERLFWA